MEVLAFETRIRDLGHEVAAIVDVERGVVRARAGGPHEVEWDDADCEEIPSRIVCHNHPGGDSFSPDDVRLAWEFGAAQLRAVTPAGVVYTLGAPERGWAALAWDEIAALGTTWAEAVFKEMEDGRLITSTPLHLIWKGVASRLDLPYSPE
jgi:hypothetical protein